MCPPETRTFLQMGHGSKAMERAGEAAHTFAKSLSGSEGVFMYQALMDSQNRAAEHKGGLQCTGASYICIHIRTCNRTVIIVRKHELTSELLWLYQMLICAFHEQNSEMFSGNKSGPGLSQTSMMRILTARTKF